MSRRSLRQTHDLIGGVQVRTAQIDTDPSLTQDGLPCFNHQDLSRTTRGGLVELVQRLDNLTTKQWHTRAIELRTLARIARVADSVHDTATRLLRSARWTRDSSP
jgi:hypothetical protein